MPLSEILVYVIVAISSLIIMGYATHMLVGGLVSPDTEYLLIAVVCFLDLIAIGYMAWDVIKRKRQQKSGDIRLPIK